MGVSRYELVIQKQYYDPNWGGRINDPEVNYRDNEGRMLFHTFLLPRDSTIYDFYLLTTYKYDAQNRIAEVAFYNVMSSPIKRDQSQYIYSPREDRSVYKGQFPSWANPDLSNIKQSQTYTHVATSSKNYMRERLFNAMGLVKQETYTNAGGITTITEYEYDAQYRLIKKTIDGQNITNYAYEPIVERMPDISMFPEAMDHNIKGDPSVPYPYPEMKQANWDKLKEIIEAIEALPDA